MIPDGDLESLKQGRFAILIIDVHAGHIGGDATIPVPGGESIIRPLDDLLKEARKSKVPIIQVLHKPRQNGVEVRSNPFWNSVSFARVYPHIREHNIGLASPLLEIDSTDYTVDTKKRYSAFYGTDLEILLRSLCVDTVVLAGLTTDCCVLNTAFDAFNRDFKVVLVENCTETDFPQDKSAVLSIVSRLLGWVMDSKEVTNLIRSAATIWSSQNQSSN